MRIMRWVLGLLLCFGITAQAADIDALIKQLRDKDTDARRRAVKELGEAGKDAQTATAALIKATKDDDLFVRRFAARALGDIEADPKVAVPALKDMLLNNKEKKEAQQAAAEALGKMGALAVPPLTIVIKADDTDNDVRRKALESVGKIGPDAKTAIPTLVAELKMNGGGTKKNPNKDRDFRVEAAIALGHVGTANDKEALDALRDLAGGKDLKNNKSLGDAIKSAVKEIEMRK
jgi:hypothetical protein